MAFSSERDLGLRDYGKDIYEVANATAWFVGRDLTTHEIDVKEMHGNVVLERDRIPPYETTARFVPDIYVKSLVSDIYTERVDDPSDPTKAKEIPTRYYVGFGRMVAPTPNTVAWSSVWTDGRASKDECLLTFIRYLEDYMLDGDMPIEDIEKVIGELGSLRSAS